MTKLRILIVDDLYFQAGVKDGIKKSLADMFSQNSAAFTTNDGRKITGVELRFAFSVASAMGFIQKHKVDVILLDQTLPINDAPLLEARLQYGSSAYWDKLDYDHTGDIGDILKELDTERREEKVLLLDGFNMPSQKLESWQTKFTNIKGAVRKPFTVSNIHDSVKRVMTNNL